MKHLSLKEALLPQPPSFAKKQSYEIHEILGSGTFGKVMVSFQIMPLEAYRIHLLCGHHVSVNVLITKSSP